MNDGCQKPRSRLPFSGHRSRLASGCTGIRSSRKREDSARCRSCHHHRDHHHDRSPACSLALSFPLLLLTELQYTISLNIFILLFGPYGIIYLCYGYWLCGFLLITIYESNAMQNPHTRPYHHTFFLIIISRLNIPSELTCDGLRFQRELEWIDSQQVHERSGDTKLSERGFERGRHTRGALREQKSG